MTTKIINGHYQLNGFDIERCNFMAYAGTPAYTVWKVSKDEVWYESFETKKQAVNYILGLGE